MKLLRSLARDSPRSVAVRVLLGMVAAYGIGVTLLLGAIGIVGDRSAWTYLVALVSFWWLLPAPVLLLVVALLRSPWCAAALLVPTVVCCIQQGPYVLNALSGPDGDATDLRVATFNVTNGEGFDSIVELVAEHAPDLLLLQEVTATPEDLSALLPEYPYVQVGEDARIPGQDAYAVVSRFPITMSRPVDGLPDGARSADVVTVEVDGRDVTTLSIHLASPCVGCSGDGTSAASGIGAAARLRVAEARRYAEVLDEAVHRGDAVVVGGDLNSSPMNEPLGELTGIGLVDVQREVGTTPGLTRGPGPGLARVDYVLVAGMTPVAVSEGSPGRSTHSPVIADLAWS